MSCEICWKDYAADTMPFVEDWLDDYAVRMTGMDDGWKSFHEYWITEGGMTPGKDYWCKVVYEGEKPVAIIAFSLYEGTYTVMELVVKTELRGHGIGTSLLRELISRISFKISSVFVKFVIKLSCAEIGNL